MVVDTSAIITIPLQEPDAERFSRALAEVPSRLVSAATLLETSMAIETRKGPEGGRDLDLLIYRAQIKIAPVDQEQAEVARAVWRRFGKGRHPACLNYCDCLACALAKVSGAPLLFEGHGFAKTDLAAA